MDKKYEFEYEYESAFFQHLLNLNIDIVLISPAGMQNPSVHTDRQKPRILYRFF